jgi:SAM-dependent methyltransferase
MTDSASTRFTDAADTWNRRFQGDEFLFGTQPNAWLRDHGGLLRPGSRVLCVADGEGRNSVWLARQGCLVDAFDISPVGVAKARQLAVREQVSVNFDIADCDNYAWPAQSCDAVAAIFIQFADPAQRERLFANMVGALKPGGMLLLHGYTPRQLQFKTGGPPFASHLYTEAMLRQAFAGLDIVELHEYDAQVSEGTGHSGKSALIGLVANKR